FVTKDANLRIRADALGLVAADYDAERVGLDEVYSGAGEALVPGTVVNEFYANGEAAIPRLGENDPPRPPNEFLLLRDEANPNHTAVARWSATKQRAVPLIRLPREGIWGVRPRNKEQSFAMDLLLDDEVKLVTLVGKAGTGKTLLAIA